MKVVFPIVQGMVATAPICVDQLGTAGPARDELFLT